MIAALRHRACDRAFVMPRLAFGKECRNRARRSASRRAKVPKSSESTKRAREIAEHVVFTGLLESDALKAVYARADVVALVSRKENFGLAAAEALSAGVPVVLSDGVDMGQHWTAPPVWRVAQNVGAIAGGLAAALAYANETGVPCASARHLADREWGTSATERLSEAYESILAARPCVRSG
ncbi:MAG TPA: glycosyltransferase [Pseudolabrys sp.]|jgi:glycosyltransferase involved in cell wall biosynthesis|nr:glycosyltransferase [Pseudolabrys sp.]